VEKLSTSEPSQLSPTRWPPEAFAWQRSLLSLLIIILAFVIGIGLDLAVNFGMGTTRQHLQSGLHLTWGITLGQLINYVPLVAVLLPIFPWLSARSLKDLGLRRVDRQTVMAVIAGAIAMYAATLISAAVQYAITHSETKEAAVDLFRSTADRPLLIAFGVLAVAIAPIVEELVFRGFIFNALLRYTPVWFAAIVSGLAFGLSHGSLSAALPLSVSGIVLALVYYRSGSLTASILTHATFNLVNIVALALGKI
jgi:uncharacterized protein